MDEFKVGDEVIIRGIINSIGGCEFYPISVLARGADSYPMGFTMDGKYMNTATEPSLFHLSEFESGDSKHLRDEISDLKHQLSITKNYYSDLEKEVKSLRAEKATFTEEYSKITLENDTLRNIGNDANLNIKWERELRIKLEAQVEILKQLLIEIHEAKNCK